MSALAIIGGAAAIYGALQGKKQADAAQDAADAQRSAARISQRQADLANARQRREQIRARRIAAANNLARSVNTGSFRSSSLAGVQGALNTNFASNLSYLDSQTDLARQRTSFLNASNAAQADSSVYGAYSRLGFTAAGKAFDIYRQTPEYASFIKGN